MTKTVDAETLRRSVLKKRTEQLLACKRKLAFLKARGGRDVRELMNAFDREHRIAWSPKTFSAWVQQYQPGLQEAIRKALTTPNATEAFFEAILDRDMYIKSIMDSRCLTLPPMLG